MAIILIKTKYNIIKIQDLSVLKFLSLKGYSGSSVSTNCSPLEYSKNRKDFEPAKEE